MWTQANEGFLDRRGCGDEIYLDADSRALKWLTGLQGGELNEDFDELDDAADDAAAH